MSIQIDWISAKIVSDLPHLYESGRMQFIGANGEFLGEKRCPTFTEDEASSSSRVRVFTPDDRSLLLSGNPVKLYQGHNLWGSADPFGLFLATGLHVRQSIGLFPSPSTVHGCGFVGPQYSRIDLTRSYRFPSHAEAQSFIRDVAGSSRSRHGAARLYGSETAYFGQHSTRWTLKVYDKHSEFVKGVQKLLGRSFVRGLLSAESQDPFIEWSRGVVRFELTLRGPELQKLPGNLSLYSSDELLDVWRSYYDRITWTENAAMSRKLPLDSVDLKLRPVLLAWSTGEDLRKMYARPTFYRYRRAVLDAVGIDIAVPPPADSESDQVQASVQLDPRGWDPEPLDAGYIPREDVKASYRSLIGVN